MEYEGVFASQEGEVCPINTAAAAVVVVVAGIIRRRPGNRQSDDRPKIQAFCKKSSRVECNGSKLQLRATVGAVEV